MKRRNPEHGITEDDFVALLETQLSRKSWPVGQVVEVMQGREGLVHLARTRIRKLGQLEKAIV